MQRLGSPDSGLRVGDRPQQALLVGIVLLAALVPRAIGIDFGLPIILHADELEPVGRAQQLLAAGGRGFDEPVAWRYPPLLAELLAIVGWLRPCEGCDTGGLIMRGRWLSAIVSALAAGLLALTGRRLGLPIWAAALGGLLFAWCPLLVRVGRYATPDALMSAMVGFGVWASAGVTSRGRWRDYSLAGVSVGLAAAAKYNAALIFVMVVAAHLLARPRDAAAWGRLVVAGALSVVVFVVVVAWPWAGFETFMAGLRYEWRHYDKGHDGFGCANAAWEALRYLFGFAIGPLAGACLGLGAIVMIYQARRGHDHEAGDHARRFALAGGLFVITYLLLLARQNLFFARLVAPLIPVIGVLVAVAAHALAEYLVARFGRSKRALVVTLVTGLVVLLPAVATVEQTLAVRATDTRLLAHRWLSENLRGPEVKVAVLPRSAMTVMPEGIESVPVYGRMTVSRMRAIGATHVVFGAGSIERFRWRPDDNREALEQWDGLHEQLRTEARLVQRWEHAPLPDARHFGDSARTIHHAAIELWALD